MSLRPNAAVQPILCLVVLSICLRPSTALTRFPRLWTGHWRVTRGASPLAILLALLIIRLSKLSAIDVLSCGVPAIRDIISVGIVHERTPARDRTVTVHSCGQVAVSAINWFKLSLHFFLGPPRPELKLTYQRCYGNTVFILVSGKSLIINGILW